MNKIIKFHNERIKWLWILTAILAISFFAICFDNVKWIYTDDKGKWELLTSSLEKIIRLYSYNLIKDPTVNGVFYTTQIFRNYANWLFHNLKSCVYCETKNKTI